MAASTAHAAVERCLLDELKDAEKESKNTAHVVRELRARLLEIQKKPTMTDADVVELSEKNKTMHQEMERFENITQMLQRLVGSEVSSENVIKLYKEQMKSGVEPRLPVYEESSVSNQIKIMNKACAFISANRTALPSSPVLRDNSPRSKRSGSPKYNKLYKKV